MTPRATTSLSIHYKVKPGQKEALLVEVRGFLIFVRENLNSSRLLFMKRRNGRMNSSSTSYGEERARNSTPSRGRSPTVRLTWRTPRNFSKQ